ncbi:MAG TPA: ABC transporter ATP-binding protein [Verrucomicrobia bacterium]|nr:ABC transporter ATP-binding protein [Verrucomicrobiota bacterium]HOB33290.1 ABC transporter ATP-binding protein [Verrucomicrobiota bacterium]HOP96728.1 ABC transporter ATP-binding protein [Verrucomicrobiota bacterium]HPU57834.1 ABC transporter ATP-binding protein [Verrucomicrobiota bacterium]
MRGTRPNARPNRQRTRAVLEAAGLRLQRGRTLILRDISWRVSPGEHWVILGANGSGKTSLLGALTGYVTPTAGSIALLGQHYGRSDWRELRKQIGIVSSSVRQMMANDEPAIETVISGKYAMIDFWGRPSRGDRLRARRILRQIECSHLADRPWLVLSQGERQRVLIGRALMASPRLLILDEPCAGLDPAAREHFLNFLQRLGSRRNSPTLVLVTHHVEEIMPVFSHVLVLKEGAVLASGPRQSILRTSVLARAFNTRLSLKRARNRYSLSVRRKTGALM